MINLLAYIDPGTTALVWQILAGVFISLGVVFSLWWRQTTNFFKSIWVKLFRKGKLETQEIEKVDEELTDDESSSDDNKKKA